MADLSCTFLDFRSLANLPLFLPSNRYYSSPLHSHRSRISIIRRRPLRLSPFSVTSSSELDVISTHEHSDGSLIFRFGDPSEVANNIEVEESKTVEEEIEGENKDVSSILEVVEGDNETGVMVDSEVTASSSTEVAKKIEVEESKTVEEEIEGANKDVSSVLEVVEGDNETEVMADSDVTASSSTEVAKNIEVEESKTVEVEKEGENKDVSSVLEVVEGDNETEVMADSEVTASSSTEAADHTDSIVSSSQTAVDGESESCEKLLEASSDTQLPVLTSSEEVEGSSAPDLGIEIVENVDEVLSEEYEDLSPVDSVIDDGSKVESDVGTVALSEKESADATSSVKEMEAASAVDVEQTENVKGGLTEECMDFLVDASILNKNSEMVNNVSTAALAVKETGEIPATDIDAEQAGTEEEALDEHEESSKENALVKSPEVANNTTTVGISEEETGEVTSVSDGNIDLPENGVLQASLEITTDVSPISEQQSMKEMQNEAIEDDRENVDSNLVSQIEEVNLEADIGTVPIGTSSESDVNDIKAFETQNVTGNGDASDTSDAEVNSPPMEAVINWSVGSEDMASESESGVLNGTVGYVSEKEMIQVVTVPLEDDSILEEETGIETLEESRKDDASENVKEGADLVEASVHEAAETESTPVSVLDSQEMSVATFVLSSGAALLPHPSKELTGGEDAYFIAGQAWLGVADGVGQWSLEGTTPGVFAQELISNCERLISTDNGDSINNPVELLNLSLSETHSPGSSSVLIAQLNGQAFRVANIGDSGFIVIRHGAIYKRSSPMHHIFHFPVQIQRGDDPSSLAETYTVDLEEEDVIIISTDGLLDNLYDQEISSIVMKSLAADKKLEEVAVLLAMRAQEIGSSVYVRTPFGDDAQAAGFVGYSGGKLDDVTVIVSVVQRR